MSKVFIFCYISALEDLFEWRRFLSWGVFPLFLDPENNDGNVEIFNVEILNVFI
ncbi:hypothetical protein SUSAZ_01840 [Sulfolobus acidocaldarius SUSAZ]|nr:hypothetical protein SUSAZ_01840 [Sulfolobus acidocaldarius SUSAZ]